MSAVGPWSFREALLSPGAGVDSFKAGPNASANGIGCVAIGRDTVAALSWSVAIGDQAAAASGSVAIGGKLGAVTLAAGIDSIAIGLNSYTDADAYQGISIGAHSGVGDSQNGIALGHVAWAGGSQSIAIGYDSWAEKTGTIAIGNEAEASAGNDAIAVGSLAIANALNAIAIGNDADVTGDDAIAIGRGSLIDSTGDGAVAIGQWAWTDGLRSTCVGWSAGSDSDYGSAFGVWTYIEASADSAVAVGESAYVDENSPGAIAIGEAAYVDQVAPNAIAIGSYAEVELDNEGGIAIGNSTFAGAFGAAYGSIAIGDNADAQGLGVCIGHNSTIPLNSDDWQDASVAIGFDVDAGPTSICIGSQISATSDEDAVAIGQYAGASDRSVGIGWASEGQPDSVSIGYYAKAASESVTIGSEPDPTNDAVSIGHNVVTEKRGDIAIGWKAETIAYGSVEGDLVTVVIGREAKIVSGGADSKRDGCVGIGDQVNVWSKHGTGIGAGARIAVDSIGAIAIGYGALGGDHGTPASGTIDCIAGSLIIEDENVVLDDGVNPAVTFQYDSDYSITETNTLRRLFFSGATTNVQCATILKDQINNAPALNMKADNAGQTSKTVTIFNTNPPTDRALGNVTITDTVIDGGFTHTGMSGGINSTVTPGAIALGKDSSAIHDGSVAIGENAVTTAASRCTVGTIGGSSDLALQCGLGLGAWGVAPPGSQPTKIIDATDLPTALTRIAAIIDVLEGAGLAASA